MIDMQILPATIYSLINIMKKITFLLLPVAILSIALPTLRADLPVYEGFEFTGSLAQKGSGSNFSGPWTVAEGEFLVQADSLHHAHLMTRGNRVVSQVNGVSIAARRFSGAPKEGEFWASVLVQGRYGSGLTFSNHPADNLNLVGRGFPERARFGFGINGDQFVYILDGRSEYPIFGSVDGATTAPTLLVVRFDISKGEFCMWANPTPGADAPEGGVQIADKVKFIRTGETFANDVNHVGLFANWGGVQLDEVRLGTSFREVTPAR